MGEPYTITWTPTTPEDQTITIVLERGPAENIIPMYAIAEGIKNTGSYEWTPETDLEDDTTHYGLQLIVDATGQYQWSTQFGISNPGYSGKPSSKSSSASASTNTRSVYLAHSSSSMYASSYTQKHAAPTGYPAGNSSMPYPTGTMSVPTSLKTTGKPKTTSDEATTATETTADATAPTSAGNGTATGGEALPTGGAGALRAAGVVACAAAAAALAL